MTTNTHIENGSMGNRWRENFWRPIREGEEPNQEFLVKFLDREAVQCHSVVAILSYVMDYPFFDTDDELTKALMRFEIVKPLHRQMTIQGVKSKIFYGSVVLFDNTVLPPYVKDEVAKAELSEMEWSASKPVEWNLFNDRTLLASLIQNQALAVMERSDVHVLRGDEFFRNVQVGKCAICRYLVSDEQETYCRADYQSTSAEAPLGRVCTNFAPRKVTLPIVSSDEYVLVEASDIYVPPFTVNALYNAGDVDSEWISELHNRMKNQ